MNCLNLIEVCLVFHRLTLILFNHFQPTNEPPINRMAQIQRRNKDNSNYPDINHTKVFHVHKLHDTTTSLENSKLQLLFNQTTGFLHKFIRLNKFGSYSTENNMTISFGAYDSLRDYSGAYLFKPSGVTKTCDTGLKFQEMIVSLGRIVSEVRVGYEDCPLKTHIVRIFHVHTELAEMINIENDVHLNREFNNQEFYMKINTEIRNGEMPRFYTDANGFQYQMRQRVNNTGVEANYYPITTGMLIQDEVQRVTLLTDHSMGGTSFREGELEVMLDRRPISDDKRGLQEGVEITDSMTHRFWLLVEKFDENEEKENETTKENDSIKKDIQKDSIEIETLSWIAQQRGNSMNYPLKLYFVESEEGPVNKTMKLLREDFLCNIHLVTARTMPLEANANLPTNEALVVLINQPNSCRFTRKIPCDVKGKSNETSLFTAAAARETLVTLLTGAKDEGKTGNIFDPDIPVNEMKAFKMTFE